ncbi:MAG: histidinol dehydrogenase [Lachnospiraceae bacterium]|nr:histidinol dehydrogenase [Lachnospiraceae bacterium]
MNIYTLDESSKKFITEKLTERSKSEDNEFTTIVNDILENVKNNGEKAIFEYTEKFDKVKITEDNFIVSEEEINEAYTMIDDKLLSVIRASIENIKSFHEKQLRNSWIDTKEGIILGQRILPLETVGLYVPGGKAAYPSSVLMNVVPAKVAGVKNIQVATPVSRDGKIPPATLVAAHEAGADVIFKMGGAQAIGAFAYGTKHVKKVDKICGPGNIFVALAKKAVYGNVSIDSIAGPSEILVFADDTANPYHIAADMLSQAEHDEMACSMLITTSMDIAEKTYEAVLKLTEELPRKDIISKSIEDYCFIMYAENINDAYDMANEIASEHLEIMTKNPFETMTYIKNAGAIFLGDYSSEPLGDYYAGPNHVLPTNGTAKFFSPLSVDDFIKKSSIISYSKDALEKVYKDIVYFAEAEGLSAHAKSIAVRFENE